MSKIITIAAREFRAIVGTKAFLLSVSIMPILMFGGFLAMQLLQERGGIEEKKIAVIDHSGQYIELLQTSAEANNAFVESSLRPKDAESKESVPDVAKRKGAPSSSKGTKYLLQKVEAAQADEAKLLELSDQIRQQKLAAILEIPGDLADSGTARLYSEDTGLSSMNFWLNDRLNERVKQLRYEKLGLDANVIRQATAPVAIKSLGLVQANADGSVKAAEEKDALASMLLPMFVMMLMFMVIFMAAQPMLESVLEEKSQRIAEVLLGSVSPSQLMAGKLIGCVGGSLTIVSLYVAGGYFFAAQKGYADMVPLHLIPWFIVFQILGVMFYASLFLAVGASVSQLKEAQSMLLPIWMLLMCPMFVWFMIVQEPNGSLAVGFSMFPPATPTTMMLRMATGVTVPIWQPIVGIVLLLLATSACVWVAGRIFRVGILWQGKNPKITELVRWAFAD